MMKRFCRENPVERIGYQKDGVADIKKHRWFQVTLVYFWHPPAFWPDNDLFRVNGLSRTLC